MAIQEKKYGFMQIGLICIFTPIFYLSCISAENKNGQPLQIDQNSRFVELQGIEPWSKHIRYKLSTCLFCNYL